MFRVQKADQPEVLGFIQIWNDLPRVISERYIVEEHQGEMSLEDGKRATRKICIHELGLHRFLLRQALLLWEAELFNLVTKAAEGPSDDARNYLFICILFCEVNWCTSTLDKSHK